MKSKKPTYEELEKQVEVLKNALAEKSLESEKTEKRLNESKALFKTVIENASTAIVLTDMERRLRLVNRTFCDLYKVKEEDVIGKVSNEVGIVAEPEREKIMGMELFKTGKTDDFELPVTTPDGRLLYLLFSCRTIQVNDEPMVLSQPVDITEKKKTENELLKYRENLEHLVEERTEELAASNNQLFVANAELQAQREELMETLDQLKKTQKQLMQSEKMASLGVLAAGVAHEINNPLNFIKGGAIAMEDYFKNNPAERIEILSKIVGVIHAGIERASSIVSSLNHYSRQNNQSNIDCDIHSIIENALIMLASTLKNKVEVNKEFTKNSPTVTGNEGELLQALFNVISNAEQAIRKKGTIILKTKVIKTKVKIEISDTGTGIKKELLDKIFDPFFTTKAPGKGTGLGLSITYNIINKHNGTIKYKSEAGNGATAIIELPLKAMN